MPCDPFWHVFSPEKLNSAPPIHICIYIQLKHMICLFWIMFPDLVMSLLSFIACCLLVNRTEREQKKERGGEDHRSQAFDHLLQFSKYRAPLTPAQASISSPTVRWRHPRLNFLLPQDRGEERGEERGQGRRQIGQRTGQRIGQKTG